LNIPEKAKIIFSINTKEIYEVIVGLPISLNLLFQFTKQASTVITSNFHESFSIFHLFRLDNFNLLGYISEITTPVCETGATILVSVVFHDAVFTTRT